MVFGDFTEVAAGREELGGAEKGLEETRGAAKYPRAGDGKIYLAPQVNSAEGRKPCSRASGIQPQKGP